MKRIILLVVLLVGGACTSASGNDRSSIANTLTSSSATSSTWSNSTSTVSVSTVPVSTVPVSTVPVATVFSAAVPLPRTDLFDQAINLQVIQAGARDVSVAVTSNGALIHTYVASSSKSSRIVTVDSPFRIASVSKMLTAITVMKLFESGVIDLDQPVVGRLADELGLDLFDERARSITPRQLLSHTSGISNFLKIFFNPGTYDQRQMLTEILAQSLESQPGTTFKYSNVNYVLLGKLIESVTGDSYEEAVRKLTLIPLDLKSFRLVGTYEFGDLDALHAVSGQRTYMEQLGAAGAWVATASDVVALIGAIDGQGSDRGFLSSASMKAMTTPATPQGVTPLWDYGLGLRLFASGEWGHSGSIENVHAMAFKRPDGLAVAILVNGSKPKETDTLIQVINEAILAARTGVPATTIVSAP